MRNGVLAAVLAVATAAGVPVSSAVAQPSTVEVNALARAAGNRREEAIKIGRSLLETRGPAQILKIRVDGVGSHQIAGLVLSGVKLREPVDPAGFVEQVIELVEATFEAGDVEEVDVWATVPIPVAPGAIVSGDLAVPTSHPVFSATVRRVDRKTYAARLRAGEGLYWQPEWRAELEDRSRAARAPDPGKDAPNHAGRVEAARAPGS